MEVQIPFHPHAPETDAWKKIGIPDELVDKDRSIIKIPGNAVNQNAIVKAIKQMLDAALDEIEAIRFHPYAPRTDAWNNAEILQHEDVRVDYRKGTINVSRESKDEAGINAKIQRLLEAAIDELGARIVSVDIPQEIEPYLPFIKGADVWQNGSDFTIKFPMLITQQVEKAIEQATITAQKSLDEKHQMEVYRLAHDKQIRDMREQYRRDCRNQYEKYGLSDGYALSDRLIDDNMSKSPKVTAKTYCEKLAVEQREALIRDECQKAYRNVDVPMPRNAKHRFDLMRQDNLKVDPYGYCFAKAQQRKQVINEKKKAEDGETCRKMFQRHGISLEEAEKELKQLFEEFPYLIDDRVGACEMLRDRILKQRQDAKAAERKRIEEEEEREYQRMLEALQKAEEEERQRQEQKRQQELQKMRASLEAKAKEKGFKMFIVYKAMQSHLVSYLVSKNLATAPKTFEPTEKDKVYKEILQRETTMKLIDEYAAEKTTYKSKTIQNFKELIQGELWMQWRHLQPGTSKHLNNDYDVYMSIQSLKGHQLIYHDDMLIPLEEKLRFEYLFRELRKAHSLAADDQIEQAEELSEDFGREKQGFGTKSLAHELIDAGADIDITGPVASEALIFSAKIGQNAPNATTASNIVSEAANKAGGEVPGAASTALENQRDAVIVKICGIAKKAKDGNERMLRQMLLEANLKNINIDEALKIASNCDSLRLSEASEEVGRAVNTLQQNKNISGESKAQLSIWSQLIESLLSFIWGALDAGKSAVGSAGKYALDWFGWGSPERHEVEEEEEEFLDASDKPFTANYAGHSTRRRSRRRRQSGRPSRRPSGVRRRRSRHRQSGRPSYSQRRPSGVRRRRSRHPSRSRRRPSGVRRRRSRRPSLRV